MQSHTVPRSVITQIAEIRENVCLRSLSSIPGPVRFIPIIPRIQGSYRERIYTQMRFPIPYRYTVKLRSLLPAIGLMVALGAPHFTVHAAKENLETGEKCRGADCAEAIEEAGGSGSGPEYDYIIGCNNTQEEDIDAASDVILRNWNDWESFVEAQTGMNVKNCLKNRFEKNGKVECESSSTGRCSGNAAWSNYLGKTAHLCPNTLDDIAEESRKPDRRACYAAVIAHEYGHTCVRAEVGADALDEATFDWYASTHNITIAKSGCGFN